MVDNKKYRVTDARVLASLAPLGPLGEISQPYLDSFESSGDMGQIAIDLSTQQRYLLVDSHKYAINDCQVAAQYGQDCNLAVVGGAVFLAIMVVVFGQPAATSSLQTGPRRHPR